MTTHPDAGDVPPIAAHQTLLARAFEDVLNEGRLTLLPLAARSLRRQRLRQEQMRPGMSLYGQERR